MNPNFMVVLGILLIFIGGFLVGLGFSKCADAHPPCDDYNPTCGYVQVVNPITGKLETQYVCE